jgi:hypothetical protein
LQDRWCKKSTVVVVRGRKIGIIGYVTTNTAFISKPGLPDFYFLATYQNRKKLPNTAFISKPGGRGCQICLPLQLTKSGKNYQIRLSYPSQVCQIFLSLQLTKTGKKPN